MNVTASNALYSGVQAFQNGSRTVTQAAQAIAEQNVDRDDPSARRDDLAEQLIQQDLGKYQALAGSKVMQTAEETLGTLLDTRA